MKKITIDQWVEIFEDTDLSKDDMNKRQINGRKGLVEKYLRTKK